METKSKEDLTMKANEFSQASTQTKCAKNKVVAVIGRWMPIHEGHKRFLIRLAKDESYGEITEICVLGADKDTLKLKFSISRKIPEIFIDRSWFSKDRYIINILEESGSVETELKSNYAILIGVELVAEVVDSTPFWGDIPLLGQLFQSKSETRQIRWLLLKVSGRGQDKNGHSHE